MKQKLLGKIFGTILMNSLLFGFTKTKTGAKTAPLTPKLSYFDGRSPQLSARVNQERRPPGVIGHMCEYGVHKISK